MNSDATAPVRAVTIPSGSILAVSTDSRGGKREGATKHVVDACCYVLLTLALAEELVGTLVVIVGRALGYSIEWQVTVGALSLGILTYFGGAIAYSQGRSVEIRALSDRLPPAWREHVKAAMDTVVLACGSFAAAASIPLLRSDWGTYSVTIPIEETFYVLPYTAGMIVLAAYGLRNVVLWCRGGARHLIAPGMVLVIACMVGGSWFAGYAVPVGGMLAVLVVATVAVLVLGIPINIAFVVGPLVAIVGTRVASPVIISVQLNQIIGKTLFVALPFFIWVGLILASSGVTLRLTRLMQLLVGRMRGGFYQVILLSMFVFSGMSGSKFADMTAVGTPLEPILDELHGERREAAAVISASAVMGETIPPSIALIVLGSVTTVSIAGLFVGGILPAVVLAAVLMVVNYVRARRGGQEAIRVPFDRTAIRTILGAVPALVIPVVIAGGIVGRLASPTEVSSLAVVYGLALALVGYRTGVKSVWASTKAALETSGWILFLIAGATALSWVLTYDQIPQAVANIALGIGTKWLFIMASAGVLIVFGLFLEGSPAIVVLAPMMVPAAIALKIAPVQYSIVLIIAMGIGAHLPPVGVGLFVASGVMKVRIEQVYRPMLVLVAFLVGALVLIALVPQITMWIPDVLHLAG
jgi:tripartite ATP-independent transporter DctM subunit